MTLIATDAFHKFAPNATAGTRDALEAAALKNGFCGRVLAHWLGQMYVESAGFTTREENLNYSVQGLLVTFNRNRISEADARKFGRTATQPANKSAIANIIYGGEWGRKNLGNTEPGDGWKFRGSGDKQLTGRANITASGYTPEELRTDPVKSALAAAAFFISHKCAEPALMDDVREVTRRVNGGYNGLDARIDATERAKALFA